MQNATTEQDRQPVLIAFSGLPGTGKSTISKLLATRLSAVYLRIDTIEQAMKSAGAQSIGPAGYAVANALAEANLRLGHWIIADCVNPVPESRLGWRNAAASAGARLVNIYLICSDATEHRHRVERRIADITGHILPTWDDVMRHQFEPRDDNHLSLDTAAISPAELVDRCEAYVTAGHGHD